VTGLDHALDEQLVAQTVQFERASVFNERLLASAYVSPLGIGFAAWLQMQATGAQRALAWSLLIVSVELLIIGFGRGFRKAVLQARPISPWLNAQLLCCGLLGLMWGTATWFVWEPEKFLFYITTLCVLVGVAFICMVVMAPMRWAIVPFALGVSIPPLVQLAFISQIVGYQIGLGWVVMIAVQLRYSVELRGELLRQIDSSVRNVMLVERLTQIGQALSLANSEKEARNAELSAVMKQLHELVTFDQLTGAYSRRYFMEELDRQVALHGRHGAPVSLIMLDLDNFKLINDRYGHSVGDRALREAALNAKAQLRDGDMLGRVGGEEFLVLLPMTGREAAISLAERLRASLAAVDLIDGAQTIQVPASFGVAELYLNESTSAWLRRADQSLYQAKAAGRNRVVAAE
jgi:diguanylate cyclase (GGDEF)-like protein